VGFFIGEIQMQTITITVDDDKTITVDVQEDGQAAGEPYQCTSAEECLQYVQSVMGEESSEKPGEAEAPENYSAMWNQESKKRGEKMSAPGEY
jgi:hypothetical protein